MIVPVLIAVLVLAFANGANDNSKGVATLVGGRTLDLKPALGLAAIATLAGSVCALLLAGGLIAKFSGKGLVDAEVLSSGTFLACVGCAAACTVLVATRFGIPISTTHALVGGLVGVALSAGALHGTAIVSAFLVPLLVSPLFALVMAYFAYAFFRRARLSLGVTRETCVCIEREFHPVSIAADGSVIMAATGLRLSGERKKEECFERYAGTVVGIDAQRALNVSHMLSAAAISFARGLNDTPKMAALVIGAGALSATYGLVSVGVAIAIGGLIAARRVGETMSYRITDMNDGQAFTANLVTALCVLVASRFGIPVSTTHVSCGSLFGIGLINRKAHWKVIGGIVLAWVATLPLAAGIGFAAWRLATP